MEKQTKIAFRIIIIGLIVFIPLSISSLVLKITGFNLVKEEINPNNDMYYNNKIWFYNESKELLAKYTCKNQSCKLATNTLDDENYSINSYREGKDEEIKPIDNKYAFIKDGKQIVLFDISNNEVNKSFEAINAESIKNYSIGISDNYFIISKNGKYGVVKLDKGLVIVLPFKYEFIGLIGNINDDNMIYSDYFVVKEDNNYKLIDKNQVEYTSNIFGEITDFYNKFLIIKNDDRYYLTGFNGEIYKDYGGSFDNEFKKLTFTDNYVNCLTIDDTFYVFDSRYDSIVSKEYHIGINDTYKTRLNEQLKLEIYINDILEETI